jgi:drug/metabolite transporter (DMT)-like permease
LRLEALRPQLKRDPLGAQQYRSQILLMPPLRVWARNALIGAGLVSYQALIALIGEPGNRSHQTTTAALAIAGAAAGLGFTALTPIRRASRLGHYVAWIVAVYIVLAVVIVPFAVAGDESAVNMVRMPIGWLLWLGAGLVTGIFCARVADRWSKGDYR